MIPLSRASVTTTTSPGDLGGNHTDVPNRLNALGDDAQHRIKYITSAYIRADAARAEGDNAEDLKYLLYAVQDISGLLILTFDNQIDNVTAVEYATSIESSVQRIGEIFGEGF